MVILKIKKINENRKKKSLIQGVKDFKNSDLKTDIVYLSKMCKHIHLIFIMKLQKYFCKK